jgi:hypothetical protein
MKENTIMVSDSLVRNFTKIKTLFTQHPNSNNMTYFTHCKRALKLSLNMGLGSFLLFVHAIFPFLFEKNGTKIIKNLNSEISG